MSDADDKFVHATDSLLALYRSVERSTLDLPVVSFMPMLIFIWAALRFDFLLVIGLVLIIPVNLVIQRIRTLTLPLGQACRLVGSAAGRRHPPCEASAQARWR